MWISLLDKELSASQELLYDQLVVNWFNAITRRYTSIVYASLNKINIIPANVMNDNCLSYPLRSDTLVVLRHYLHHCQTEAFK